MHDRHLPSHGCTDHLRAIGHGAMPPTHCAANSGKQILCSKYGTAHTYIELKRSATPSRLRGSGKTSDGGHRQTNASTPESSKPRRPLGGCSSTNSAGSSILRKRCRHADTYRPLSPIYLARLPSSPHGTQRCSPTPAPHSPSSLPPSRAPPLGGGRARGHDCSPSQGGSPFVRGKSRETTNTSPTDLATRTLNFDDSTSPAAPSCAAAAVTVYVHRAVHAPGLVPGNHHLDCRTYTPYGAGRRS